MTDRYCLCRPSAPWRRARHLLLPALVLLCGAALADTTLPVQELAPATGSPAWTTIGAHGCWGLPEVDQDPLHPGSCLLTWQRYRPGSDEKVMDVKYSVFNAATRSFSEEAFLFDPDRTTLLQAHPCWARWNGQYRMFYCECRKQDPRGGIVGFAAPAWQDFQRCDPAHDGTAITGELGFHPHMQFLPVSGATAWLFYTLRDSENKLYYSVCDSHDRWDKTARSIPTARLAGGEALTLGSTFMEGGDVVLYGSTYEHRAGRQTDRHGVAWRFRCADHGGTWTAEKLIVSGIEEPFKKSGELFVRVVRHGARYFLSSQSGRSHRYLAEGRDGIHFQVIQDFGERPSFGNTMAAIAGTDRLLLVYAGNSGAPELGGDIECLLVSVGSGPP